MIFITSPLDYSVVGFKAPRREAQMEGGSAGMNSHVEKA
jgi:hypothetical protein